ncbi:MAG: putative transcriptional regulator of 4-carboxymuconolactone decarboxylase, Rrf2 family [Devosia sp.]|uniref:RrF2 family transcriptional regulator n=1 Tax=Devosia sp. TaxID=1871048 RepID=UPI0026316E79|nr:Rrf2 family transcriptional regulator [Devosia sp.]MDB5587666.1 putative transcriptional regulator of 4-carboxymuconolactone decarboxylase, Rrf2 family [Devosia sp.]
MKLGDGVEQAIHSVSMLSGLATDGVLAAAALAEYHGVSTSYLLKHLQALAGAGILQSVPGPKGGYRLARPATKISLLDIVLAIEGPAPAFRCAEIRQRGPAPLAQEFYKAPCAINAAMLKAEQAYRAELRKISVADLQTDKATPLGAAIDQRGCAFLDRHERRQPVPN